MMIPRRNGLDIFDDVFSDPFFTQKENKLMKTDVKEKDGNYILEIDIPGYDKDDIKIEFNDGYITVTATKNEEKEDKQCYNKNCELYYMDFNMWRNGATIIEMK